MGTYVDRYWPGNPGGYTPKTRRAGDFRAYVPDLLADLDLHIPAGLADSVTGVTRQLDSLNAGQPGLEQLEPMARFLLRCEAVASSWMEGLTIGVRRLARAEAASRADLELHDDTAQAVLGNIHAIDKALDIAGDPARPVTVGDILTIHEATLARTKDARFGGVLRPVQNWIGTSLTPLDAVYIPPPPELVGPLMEDLAAYLTSTWHPALV